MRLIDTRCWRKMGVGICALMFISLAIIVFTDSEARGAAKPKPLPEVWGAIKFHTLVGNMPGVPANLTISLKAKDGSYNKTLKSSDNDVKRALSSGKFTFRNVPTEVTMYLEMTYVSPSGSKDRYFSSFVFHYPKTNPIQSKKKALKMAGYTADFTITIEPAKIKAENRYEK